MLDNNPISDFIKGIPKAELHVHIEGTFEPELMFTIAKRNGKQLKFQNVEELNAAYQFNNLQSFLDIYYAGASVLIEEQDFYDLTWAYLLRAKEQNVIHTEIFFDPQTHTSRGIAFEIVVQGISKALNDGREKLGISSMLIMCFLRHLDETSAIETLSSALLYKHLIVGVGLDSSEKGHPPSKFQNAFNQALNEGFLTVAHAGEEGPAEYVNEALQLLKVSRIDHGNRSIDDKNLVIELVNRKIPLTVCPLSNLKLKVVHDLTLHPLKEMLDLGLLVTVNSDDPAYFGGYINENYQAVTSALGLTNDQICQLARNSIQASFLKDETKNLMLAEIDLFCMKSI